MFNETLTFDHAGINKECVGFMSIHLPFAQDIHRTLLFAQKVTSQWDTKVVSTCKNPASSKPVPQNACITFAVYCTEQNPKRMRHKTQNNDNEVPPQSKLN